jgi:hypothetical protein
MVWPAAGPSLRPRLAEEAAGFLDEPFTGRLGDRVAGFLFLDKDETVVGSDDGLLEAEGFELADAFDDLADQGGDDLQDLLRAFVGDRVEVAGADDEEFYFVRELEFLAGPDQVLQFDVVAEVSLFRLEEGEAGGWGGSDSATEGGDQLVVFPDEGESVIRFGHEAGHADLGVGGELGADSMEAERVFLRELLFELDGELVAEGVNEEVGNAVAGVQEGRDLAIEDLGVAQDVATGDGPAVVLNEADELGLKGLGNLEVFMAREGDELVEDVVVFVAVSNGLFEFAVAAVEVTELGGVGVNERFESWK